MEQISSVLGKMIGRPPKRITPLSASNNAVLKVEGDGGEFFILKRFEPERRVAFERESQMRACLRSHSALAFPPIAATFEHDGNRFVLMERIHGESLLARWEKEPRLITKELPTLGRMLASLHQIPVSAAEGFLRREETLFSEKYFLWMAETIAPHLPSPDLRPHLDRCYQAVQRANLPETITHGDFGPHQVMVDEEEGRWVLMDFEYAVISPFADDLGGTEVRLERRWRMDTRMFLDGYFSHRGLWDDYRPVQDGFKAYALLSMLTYQSAHRGKTPSQRDIEQLEHYLTKRGDATAP